MNHGDPILLEAPLYAGVLPYLQSIDAEMIGQSLSFHFRAART